MIDAGAKSEIYWNIEKQLGEKGFDLFHPIHTSWYNALIKGENLVESGTLKLLPEPSAILGEDGAFNAILIGNTKHIWPIFLDWLASRVEEEKRENCNLTDKQALEHIKSPFDAFVETSIQHAIQQSCKGISILSSYELYWSNGKRQKLTVDGQCDSADTNEANNENNFHCFDDTNKDSFLVSMQRVAITTGKYWHDDGSTKLCVHPEYGTWTAFRTLVIFETRDKVVSTNSIPQAPSPCPCPVTDEEIKAAKIVFDYALKMSSDEQGYAATLTKSWQEVSEYLHETVCSGSEWEKVPSSMKGWIQLRDCISIGRKDWRYSQPQLLYHYTRDAEILCMELKRITDERDTRHKAKT